MTLPYSLWLSSKETAGFGQTVVKIPFDCGIIGYDATQLSKVVNCVEVGASDADRRRVVRFPWS